MVIQLQHQAALLVEQLMDTQITLILIITKNNAIPIIGITSATVNTQQTKYIDFLIPGLIGFSILTSPMFSLVNISSEYKKTKLFKQLSLTPLTKMEWLTSKDAMVHCFNNRWFHTNGWSGSLRFRCTC